MVCLQTNSITVEPGKDTPVTYSDEHFSSRAPLVYGSVILANQDSMKRMVVRVPPAEGATAAIWLPKLFVVSQDMCTNFLFEEAAAGSPSLRLAALHVQASKRLTPRTINYETVLRRSLDAKPSASLEAALLSL